MKGDGLTGGTGLIYLGSFNFRLVNFTVKTLMVVVDLNQLINLICYKLFAGLHYSR